MLLPVFSEHTSMTTVHTLVPFRESNDTSGTARSTARSPGGRQDLVEHAGQLYVFSDLLQLASERALYAALRNGPPSPQDWWDEVLRSSPGDAARIVAQCRPFRAVERGSVVAFRPKVLSGDGGRGG